MNLHIIYLSHQLIFIIFLFSSETLIYILKFKQSLIFYGHEFVLTCTVAGKMQNKLVRRSLTTKFRSRKLLFRVARPLLEKIFTDRIKRFPRKEPKNARRCRNPIGIENELGYSCHNMLLI